jgi:hypothetical protein
MRNLTIFVLQGLMLFGAGTVVRQVSAQTPAQSPTTSQAVPYSSLDGRFSVTFPGGTVKQETEQIALQGGGSSTLYEFWVELDNNNVSYLVMYNDYPPNFADDGAEAVLARTRDGAVKDKTLTSDVVIDLNGIPGRAFTCTDKDWNYSVHQFLAGKRLYQLIVVSNSDHPAAYADEFMNSFKIN